MPAANCGLVIEPLLLPVAAGPSAQGDAIPAPPATWSAEMPSATDLQTPFGQLYAKIRDEVSPAKAGSLVNNMNDGANLLGIPGFTEE